MAVAVLFAIVGTTSSLAGLLLLFSVGAPGGDPGISLNGWLVLFGWACYALSAVRALQVARTRWIAATDALWPLVWSLYLAAITLWFGSAIGEELLGEMLPGRYPWAPFVILGLGAACSFAASMLILERIVARTVRLAQALTTR